MSRWPYLQPLTVFNVVLPTRSRIHDCDQVRGDSCQSDSDSLHEIISMWPLRSQIFVLEREVRPQKLAGSRAVRARSRRLKFKYEVFEAGQSRGTSDQCTRRWSVCHYKYRQYNRSHYSRRSRSMVTSPADTSPVRNAGQVLWPWRRETWSRQSISRSVAKSQHIFIPWRSNCGDIKNKGVTGI